LKSAFNNIRYYLTSNGILVEIWQNPCGCHPFDAIIKYEGMTGIRKNGLSYSFKNQQGVNGYVRRRRLERLK